VIDPAPIGLMFAIKGRIIPGADSTVTLLERPWGWPGTIPGVASMPTLLVRPGYHGFHFCKGGFQGQGPSRDPFAPLCGQSQTVFRAKRSSRAILVVPKPHPEQRNVKISRTVSEACGRRHRAPRRRISVSGSSLSTG
jgi:hypothetical protein